MYIMYSQKSSQPILTDPHRLEKLLKQDFTGMDVLQFPHGRTLPAVRLFFKIRMISKLHHTQSREQTTHDAG
jgi:hypothetical protein